MGVVVTFDFSISDKEECADPRLPEKASESMRGKNRDLDGVVGRFCTKFGVDRVGVGGWLAGDSLRECGFARTRPDERLIVRCRGVGVGGRDEETALASSEDRGVSSPWKTFITDHLLRLRVVLLLPLLCDTDSEVRGRDGSSIVSRASIMIAC